MAKEFLKLTQHSLRVFYYAVTELTIQLIIVRYNAMGLVVYLRS